MFTEQTLQKGLNTRVFGNKIYTFDSIDSTNNCAKAVAGCGAKEGTIIIAEHQTAGKGRLGRQWEANPNENLIFSIVLRPRLSPDATNLLPLYVAVALSQAIERMTGLTVECKWPNDLLINNRKVAGVLIEASTKNGGIEHVVIGVGVNVNQHRFAGELQSKATSLKLALGREVDRAALFQEILSSLESNYNSIMSDGLQSIVPTWLSRSSMVNRKISVSERGTVISGIVKGLSNEGGLVLKTATAERTLYAGDVTIVGM
jgi:BirA family transcriptional regulator, biotin operon repressor / biotin---[acetyl-CoA-carboxylase] ligase